MNEIQTSFCADTVSRANTVQTGADQPTANQSGFVFSSDSVTLRSHRTQAEIHAIRQALARTGWIRKRAAKLLAISYRSLLYKIERYKIAPPNSVSIDTQNLMAQPQIPGQSLQVG